MSILSQNVLIVLKKLNAKSVLKLDNLNHSKKKEYYNPKSILQGKSNICVIKRDICTCTIYILYRQYNKNTIKKYENYKKMSKKHKDISKSLLK